MIHRWIKNKTKNNKQLLSTCIKPTTKLKDPNPDLQDLVFFELGTRIRIHHNYADPDPDLRLDNSTLVDNTKKKKYARTYIMTNGKHVTKH